MFLRHRLISNWYRSTYSGIFPWRQDNITSRTRTRYQVTNTALDEVSPHPDGRESECRSFVRSSWSQQSVNYLLNGKRIGPYIQENLAAGHTIRLPDTKFSFKGRNSSDEQPLRPRPSARSSNQIPQEQDYRSSEGHSRI